MHVQRDVSVSVQGKRNDKPDLRIPLCRLRRYINRPVTEVVSPRSHLESDVAQHLVVMDHDRVRDVPGRPARRHIQLARGPGNKSIHEIGHRLYGNRHFDQGIITLKRMQLRCQASTARLNCFGAGISSLSGAATGLPPNSHTPDFVTSQWSSTVCSLFGVPFILTVMCVPESFVSTPPKGWNDVESTLGSRSAKGTRPGTSKTSASWNRIPASSAAKARASPAITQTFRFSTPAANASDSGTIRNCVTVTPSPLVFSALGRKAPRTSTAAVAPLHHGVSRSGRYDTSVSRTTPNCTSSGVNFAERMTKWTNPSTCPPSAFPIGISTSASFRFSTAD